jgi:hypothetical protein
MAISKTITAADAINRAAVECGLLPVSDPYASSDEAFIQLKFLLQTAGEDLVLAHPWEFLNREFEVLTGPADSGVYDLPDDFIQMIDQTGWERAGNVPLFGPLTPQDWAWLKGRDLVDSTIYASFRLNQGKFNLFPSPPPEGLDINIQYQSNEWVEDGLSLGTFKSEIVRSGDIILFDRTLITRLLKVKFLDAKGFDTTTAQQDFNQTFNFLIGKDKGGTILNAGGRSYGIPYLDFYSIPDSGFGIP